jgi:Reverse transcriptase (RNA-dependent DNA polymerase).
MPFGLSTAPATFQRMMNTIFFEMLDKGVLIYLDDILVYSKTIEEHKKLLDRVFYYLNLNKLYGHVISKDGVSMESGKSLSSIGLAHTLNSITCITIFRLMQLLQTIYITI